MIQEAKWLRMCGVLWKSLNIEAKNLLRQEIEINTKSIQYRKNLYFAYFPMVGTNL